MRSFPSGTEHRARERNGEHLTHVTFLAYLDPVSSLKERSEIDSVSDFRKGKEREKPNDRKNGKYNVRPPLASRSNRRSLSLTKRPTNANTDARALECKYTSFAVVIDLARIDLRRNAFSFLPCCDIRVIGQHRGIYLLHEIIACCSYSLLPSTCTCMHVCVYLCVLTFCDADIFMKRTTSLNLSILLPNIRITMGSSQIHAFDWLQSGHQRASIG